MGSFTGNVVLNSKLISIAPLDAGSTMGTRKGTVKSENSPSKAVADAQEEGREEDEQIAEVAEREDLDERSGDSIVTEISDGGRQKPDVKSDKADVEKLIDAASNPAAYAANEAEFPDWQLKAA